MLFTVKLLLNLALHRFEDNCKIVRIMAEVNDIIIKLNICIKWASKLSRTLEDDPPAAQAELFAKISDLILKLTLLLIYRLDFALQKTGNVTNL